ncbi:MAG TPA: DnaA/Hda family protein [Stellaceae bacterium]|nr:DnaA/Hda family protein [Stellaceae bacterium]
MTRPAGGMGERRQLPLDLGHDPAFGLGDFLVADSNQAAVAWLDRWPRWPAPALVLVGPPGSGKTHLACLWQARSGARRIAGCDLTPSRVPDLLGDAQAIVVDDARQAGEQALLHLYNMIAERRGHALLTATAAPARWPIALADLRSRLVAAPLIELAPPDDALLGAVLVKLFADRQIAVGQEVVAFLATRLERSFEAARRVVAAIDQAALAAGRPVTVPLAREVLLATEAEHA